MDLYYKPTKGELKSDPDYFSKYYAVTDPIVFPTNKMPIKPVRPATIRKKVVSFLESKPTNTIGVDSKKQIEDFCRLFNFNIELNQENKNMLLVHAAQTGTAKSLSLKMYLSTLSKESSLIVVSKVDEAKEYCKFINDQRGDQDYARCYYALTDKNKTSEYRVENYELKNYQCIVISHEMFRKLNQSDILNNFRLYNKKQRDLIVIDEHISFYNSYKITQNEITKLKDNLIKFSEQLGLDENDNGIKLVDGILNLFDMYEEEFNDRSYEKIKITSLPNSSVDSEELLHNINDIELETIEHIYNQKIEMLLKELKEISSVSSGIYEADLSKGIRGLLDRIQGLFQYQDDHYDINYYNGNSEKLLFRVENIVNKLGSCIILDATASINESYKIAYRYNTGTFETTVRQTRKYNNLTVHKAKGYPQSRYRLYKGITSEQAKQNAKMYISHANNILQSPDDKMLIITHKDFKKYLVDECDDNRIVMTHWGDHVGSNKWNDCNKVMVIGWNFFNEFQHIFNGLNALNDDAYNNRKFHLSNDVIQALETTQLADDLIQGVMRSKARNVATRDGDCEQTDVYLYYEDKDLHNDVIEAFISHFPDVNVQDWTPVGLEKSVRKTKPNKNVDRIIAYLEKKASEDYLDVMLKDAIEDLGINKATMNRITTKNEYFQQRIAEKGYIYKNADGRSKHFILK